MNVRLTAAIGRVQRFVNVSVDAVPPCDQNSKPVSPARDHTAGGEITRTADAECALYRPTVFVQHLMIVPALASSRTTAFGSLWDKAWLAMLDFRDLHYVATKLATRSSDELPQEPVGFTGSEAQTRRELQDRLMSAQQVSATTTSSNLATNKRRSWPTSERQSRCFADLPSGRLGRVTA